MHFLFGLFRPFRGVRVQGLGLRITKDFRKHLARFNIIKLIITNLRAMRKSPYGCNMFSALKKCPVPKHLPLTYM
jgi:hypothetical protein